MKISCTFLLIVIVVSVVSYRVTADSEEAGVVKKDQVSLKSRGGEVSEKVDHVKNDENSNLNKNDSIDGLESKNGGENDKKNVNAAKDVQKEDNVSNSMLKKEPKEVPVVRGKCDSFSNSCTDDEKMLVACLRVPGNESPDLSLLIQNKGKGPLTVTISTPDLVKLEKSQIELQDKEDAEVKVSIRGVENGHFIILTAGHGNCSLDFRDQFVGNISESTYFNFSKRALFLFFIVLLIVVGSVSMCIWRRYFAIKGQKYQKLNMVLPVSHGSSKLESGVNEGWDDSWGDNWDDEEAVKVPSLPVTPSLSSKGMASRKFNKDTWKD